MAWSDCTHKRADDFSVIVNNVRIWKCSHCKRQDKWSESWGYHGSMECSKCWTADIDFVFCSDACRDELAKKHGVSFEKPKKATKHGKIERPKRKPAWQRKAELNGWKPPA